MCDAYMLLYRGAGPCPSVSQMPPAPVGTRAPFSRLRLLTEALIKGERHRPVNRTVTLAPPRLEEQSILAEQLGLPTDLHGQHLLHVHRPVDMIQDLGLLHARALHARLLERLGPLAWRRRRRACIPGTVALAQGPLN